MEGPWESWDVETLGRFGELENGRTCGFLTVWEVGGCWSLGTPDTAAAPSEGGMGWAHQQREDGNIYYYCRKTGGGGSRKNTGRTRRSLNSDTVKAPPTLMTFFSPKQLKCGGGGGGNGLTGRVSGIDS